MEQKNGFYALLVCLLKRRLVWKELLVLLATWLHVVIKTWWKVILSVSKLGRAYLCNDIDPFFVYLARTCCGQITNLITLCFAIYLDLSLNKIYNNVIRWIVNSTNSNQSAMPIFFLCDLEDHVLLYKLNVLVAVWATCMFSLHGAASFDQVCQDEWWNCVQDLETRCYTCNCSRGWGWCICPDFKNLHGHFGWKMDSENWL